MNQQLNAWLESKNQQYEKQEIPVMRRPFMALGDYSLDFKHTVLLRSPLADQVFDWFYERSDPEAHLIGPLFVGAFYFDAYFWPLDIPLGYGRFLIEPIKCMRTMPELLKARLRQNQQDLDFYFADCLDYAYGLKEIEQSSTLAANAISLLISANAELKGAISQITDPRPNTKAILALRMACEIAMKALLVQEKAFSEKDLKVLGHKIPDIARACYDTLPRQVFDTLASGTMTFPEVTERYEAKSYSLNYLWEAVRNTQLVAATVVRKYVDYGMRYKVLCTYRDEASRET